MNHINYRENFRSSAIENDSFLMSIGFRIFLSILVLCLLGLYVARISVISVKGYDISNLEHQVKTLQEENQKIEFDIANKGSMQNIQARLQGIPFVPVEKPEYVQAPIVAQR
jgi:hypothetical protein